MNQRCKRILRELCLCSDYFSARSFLKVYPLTQQDKEDIIFEFAIDRKEKDIVDDILRETVEVTENIRGKKNKNYYFTKRLEIVQNEVDNYDLNNYIQSLAGVRYISREDSVRNYVLLKIKNKKKLSLFSKER